MKNSARAIFIVLGLLAGAAEAATVTYTASGTWTAPAGVTSVTVEAWGGGGGGGAATGNPSKGGGGAGGQYAKRVVTVTPGNTYAFVVGAGGTVSTTTAGGAGGDSTFAATTVVAKGGAGGGLASTNSSGGTAGVGSSTGGVGDVVYAGGSGSAGVFSSTGGAGGGGAGSGGAGGGASANSAGTGTATGGGNGGAGIAAGTSSNGNAGSVAGGGGGGGNATGNTDRSGGAGAGGQLSITYATVPTVTTNAASALTTTGATLNGTVSSNGASTTVTFDYGLTTGYGSTVTATPSPLAAGASGTAVSAVVTGLTCNTTYHFRVNGQNSVGTTNGSDATFTTSACLPTVTTNAATNLTATGATLNGTVSSNGASTTVTFDYGLTTGYGTTATATASPLGAGATGTAVAANVTGLTCGTTYHFRVNGVNSAGTANGSDTTFTTAACAVVLGKTAGASAGVVGSNVSFTLLANNPSTVAMTNVVLTDNIPIGLTYVTSAPTLGTAAIAGQLLTWTIPYLPAGGGAQLTLVVKPAVKGSYTNTVQSSGAADASATILILPSAITRYSMDEAAGSWTGAAGEVIDSGGTNLSGHRQTTATPTTTNTVAPSPTIASQHSSVVGGFCNAGRFDGNAVVVSATGDYFKFAQTLSASAWIYPTAYPTSDLYSILSNDVNYEFHLDTGGHLYWWWQASTLTSAATIPLNTWTHIAITMDSSLNTNSRQRIYINGVADANTNNWSGTLAVNYCPFYIGGDITTGAACALIPARNFHGMIDEVKIYNYELSAPEVNADMNLGRLCGAATFDHIQIEHDGTASTCAPKTVTVKACMDASCSNLYTAQPVTVHLSPSGWTPSDVITINGGVTTATLSNSSISTPSLTLGTTSVSPSPANNTRCFNGATETCTLSVGSTACTFDAAEPGANPQSHLFTKLAGTPFNIDILAVGSPATSVDTSKNSTVSVDLVDTSSAACTGSSTALTTPPQSVTLVAGRKTVAMTCATAAPSAQVRIRIGSVAPYSYACSSDKLAVRPSGLTLTSSNTLATPPSATDTHSIKAGAAFNIGATTSPAAYTGVLTLVPGMLTAQDPSKITQQSGGAIGNLGLAPFTIGTTTYNSAIRANTAQGGNATYGEVGYFYANPGSFSDTGFTSVDQSGQLTGCVATDTCDCLLSTHVTNGSVPDNVSDVLINGRYGCYVGNNTGYAFGRFIPDHFDTAINTATTSGVPMLCPAGQTCPDPAYAWSYADATARLTATGFVTTDIDKIARQQDYNTFWKLTGFTTTPTITSTWDQFVPGFVYSGQGFATQVTAKNLAGGTTQNYTSNFAREIRLEAWDALGSTAIQNPSGLLSNFTMKATTASFGAGVIISTTPPPPPSPTTLPIYTLSTAATAPTNIYVRATESTGPDGVTSSRAAASVEGGVRVMVGRMKVSNAYGSELLPLPITATVQYWDGSSWLTSSSDSLTSFNAATNLVPSIVKGPLAVGNIVMPNAMVAVTNGVTSTKISAPGVTGIADIGLGGVGAPNYLLTGSNGAATNPSVAGRLTFGVYKGTNEFIYMREAY